MKARLLTFVLFFSTSLLIFSQENTANQWFFGEYCGVDFSHGVPHGVTGGQITGWEGCATVGDMEGNLLFYTDGQVVYNRNHDIMENGTGLMGHWSSTQSSIIIKHPGNENLYYIFTTDDTGDQHLANGWRYSLVDITLAGGLGAINETKNVLLEEMVTEKQVAIMHTNNVNVWIIAHKWNSNEFVAYEITPTGINPTPIISALGTVHAGGSSPTPQYNGWTNAVGLMKTNRDGNKIALAIQIMGIFELFDFNKTTGSVSNCRTSPTYNAAYGVEFSPNGEILYATKNIYGTSTLFQYDITQSDPFSNPIVIASETKQNEGLQLGPNGKIYVTRFLGQYLAEIHFPDEIGAACGYESNAVFLEGAICHRGLPSIFFYKGFEFFTGSEVNIEICNGDSIFLQNAYQSTEGTYYDTVQSYLGWDSIVNTHLTLSSAVLATISETSGTLFSSYLPNYQWYYNGTPILGANSNVYIPVESGNYQVGTVTANSCYITSNIFTFIVNNLTSINNNYLKIYPNPVSDYLEYNCIDKSRIRIFDISGKIILQEEINAVPTIIDCTNWEKGIYFLQVKTENKADTTIKLTKI